MYYLCVWGFIVNDYVPLKHLGGFSTWEAARDAMTIERAERDARRQYTDMGTFAIRKLDNV